MPDKEKKTKSKSELNPIEKMIRRFKLVFERMGAHESEGDNADYICQKIKDGEAKEFHTTVDGKIFIVTIIEDDREKAEAEGCFPTGCCC